MKTSGKIFGLVVLAIVAVAFAYLDPKPADALDTIDLDATSGYSVGTSRTLSISSSAAVQVPTLPVGKRGFEVISANAFNYGDSAITTATTELFVATATVKEFKNFTTRTPAVYFRCRGTDTAATMTVVYK